MKTILVIEDDRPLLELTTKILEQQGYAVVPTADGREGMAQAQHCLPDLIICDLMIPSIDGLTVVETLHREPITAGIPIIIMTALSDLKMMRLGMGLGADDYLTKPVTPEEILAAVKARFEKQARCEEQSIWRLETMKKHVATSIPDDIYPPLDSILDLSDLLLHDGLSDAPDQIAEIGQQINRSAWRLWHLFKGYLVNTEVEFTRAQEQVDYQDSVKTLIEAQAMEAAGQNLRQADLRLDIEDTRVPGVPATYVQRIVRELIDNAFKFSGEGTPVTVRTRLVEEGYLVQISDRGRGITSEQLADIGIFSHRVRDDEQVNRGLGLMIVHQLATLCGASLDIESEPDKRTTMSVLFPLGLSAAPADHTLVQST